MQDKGLYNADSLGIESALSTNKVLKNTYMLLGMTLLFSAGMAALAMALEVPYMGFLPMLVAFGLIFAISKMRNSHYCYLRLYRRDGSVHRANAKLLSRDARWSGTGNAGTG